LSKHHLDPALLKKLQRATGGKSLQYIREQISRKASKLGISSVAAQIVWAKEHGKGVAHALNALPAEIREEVRNAQRIGKASPRTLKATDRSARPAARTHHAITAATVNSLLQDETLRDRCKDLLAARKHFDRVFREATTVLDDRLKATSGIKNMNPVNLIGKALNPDPKLAIIEISPEPDEQRGFHAICQGVMLAFRNKAHHSLSDKFTREDALKFCEFIDTILGAITQADIHPDRP
jgi:uncharacterized protein (TIGR02391 family)